MKKILLAFDGNHFSPGAFEFVRELNQRAHVLVTAVFIPQVNYANLWSYAASAGEGGLVIPVVQEEDTELQEKNISHFESMCRKNDMAYRIHSDFAVFTLDDLKRETRFADVMVIGSESFYQYDGELEYNKKLRDALTSSECPVVLVPEKYRFPLRNIIAYDGSSEAVYAMKQFAYIFPELAANDTLLVYAKEHGDNSFPSEYYIRELAMQHFRELTFHKLDFDPKKYFSSWISERQDAILVSGSFGRSSFSQLFKKSFVSAMIDEHQLPVFIAHKK